MKIKLEYFVMRTLHGKDEMIVSQCTYDAAVSAIYSYVDQNDVDEAVYWIKKVFRPVPEEKSAESS